MRELLGIVSSHCCELLGSVDSHQRRETAGVDIAEQTEGEIR